MVHDVILPTSHYHCSVHVAAITGNCGVDTVVERIPDGLLVTVTAVDVMGKKERE